MVGTSPIWMQLSNSWGHYITNPNNALLPGKSLKITIDLHCLIPPKMDNIMTPEIAGGFPKNYSLSFEIVGCTVWSISLNFRLRNS